MLHRWFICIIAKQVEAEICIAAYEACAHALKDLVSVFSPMTLDIVADSDISFQIKTDDKALLDGFVSTFMHNINQIIDGGRLARSRRAILMNWKVLLPCYCFLIFLLHFVVFTRKEMLFCLCNVNF